MSSSKEALKNINKDSEQKIKSPDKKRIPDVVDGEIVVSSTKVIREQVLAERDARKKAKQLEKQHKKVTSEKVKLTSLTEKYISEDLIFSDHKAGNHIIPNAKICNPSELEIKSLQTSDTVGLKEHISESKEDLLKHQMPSDEKSRKEVLAEREAKKKAKQLAKLKKAEKGSNSDSSLKVNVEPITISSPQNPVNEKVDGDVKKILVEVKSNILGNEKITEKSKSELRAERRAKQEAQRAAKEAEKKLKTEAKENTVLVPEKLIQANISVKEIKAPKTKIASQQRIKLFSHLQIVPKQTPTQIIQNIHPSIIELGVKYSSRIINGSNARCVALLNCLKQVINDYTTPLEKEFSRGLESKLNELTNYLNECRPMAVSMTNALRHIKSHLNQLPNNISDHEAKRKLVDVIDTFIREQIDVAGEAICEAVKNKIANGDVVLIYSCSSLLYRILSESFRSGRQFRVVVVDGGPWFEGREILRRLVDAGLSCTYVQVSAVSFIMRQATKVFLGAHALLANGSVMSRAGASLVALAAHSCNVPVLVCCETYKFCERVQTDAFVYNELGSADDVVGEDERLRLWKSDDNLSPLSLLYDITPPDLVTAVVTELAILPCTSVPVILRLKPSDLIS